MPKTLLLADDSVTIQKVVGISFANEDLALVTVDNGDDAIVRIRETRPDIVLADVVMPGKSGYEVCEAVKSDPALQHIPVLLLTGTFEAFDAERAQQAGADGHVTKPFEAQALVDEVNALLARSAAPAAASATPAEPSTPPTEAAQPLEPETLATDALADEVAVTGEVEAESSGGSFEFFDEEVTAPTAGAPMSAQDDAPSPGAAAAASGDDGAFSFDTEPDLEVPEPLPPGTPPARDVRHDETVVMSASDAARWASSPDAVPVAAEPPPVPVPRAAAAPSVPPPDNDATVHAFDDFPTLSGDDPLNEMQPQRMATEAVLDPAGGRGYDVSSSDLGESGAAPLPAAPPRAPAGGEEDDLPVSAPLPSPKPAELRAEPPAPLTVSAPTEPEAMPSAAPAPGEPRFEATPELRQEIREAIEKVAWEALGPVAEKLVHDAIETVEKVAWEVVPQLAETLVREEIRKLKGGGGD